jgi:(1->4)-alpha-D-glucan 1-alpha-D-glucosylmutase
VLAERRRRPNLFDDGTYIPLSTTGANADNVVALARTKDDSAMAVIVPRLVSGLGAGEGRIPLGATWSDCAILCPAALADRRWTDIFTGQTVTLHREGEDRIWRASEAFSVLPVVALTASEH